jgi:hypothetical protein
MSSSGVCITNGLPLPLDRTRCDGPGQIGQPRLGGCVQQRAQDRRPSHRERPGLGFDWLRTTVPGPSGAGGA